MIHDARLMPAAAGAWAVAAVVTHRGVATGIGVAMAAAVVACVAGVLRGPVVVVAALVVAAVAGLAALRVDVVESSEASRLAAEQAQATIRLRLVTDPRTVDGPGGERVWFWARTTHVTAGPGSGTPIREGVMVTVSADGDTAIAEAAAGE